MGTINDERGCSVCQPGKENYTTFTTRLGRKTVTRFQYDYRTLDGDLFSCVSTSLEDCRARRDEWVNKRSK